MKLIKGHIIEAAKFGSLNILENGYLVLDDSGTILAVYTQDTLPLTYRKLPVTDYKDRLILQSFADMHLHAPQYPMIGMAMDKPLLDWLDTYTFPLEANYTDLSFARKVYAKLAEELIQWGTTRVCMFSSMHTDATIILMEELEKKGITGYVGKVNMDRNGGAQLEETTEESMNETLRFLTLSKRFRNLHPIITPRFTPSCTDKLMHWLGDLSKQQGLYVQSHLSENLSEIAWVKELHPDCEKYWQTYDKYGLWKDHTLMAHCIHMDAAEMDSMAAHGVYAVHCPDSNINLQSGICHVKDLLSKGVSVVLGSDIAAGAEIGMSRVITSAIRSSKILSIESNYALTPLTVAEAYFLGSSSGHAYFNDKYGFSVGNKLHAIVVDDSDRISFGSDSLKDRFEKAIYRMSPKEIVCVYANGVLVKDTLKNGESV